MWSWVLTGPETKKASSNLNDLPGWGLDTRVTHLALKIIVAKSKEVKAGSNLAESSKEGFSADDDKKGKSVPVTGRGGP
jgi:hypothetical protein